MLSFIQQEFTKHHCLPGFVLGSSHAAENKAAHGTPILEKGDTINKETNTQDCFGFILFSNKYSKTLWLKNNSHFLTSYRLCGSEIKAGLGWATGQFFWSLWNHPWSFSGTQLTDRLVRRIQDSFTRAWMTGWLSSASSVFRSACAWPCQLDSLTAGLPGGCSLQSQHSRRTRQKLAFHDIAAEVM